MPFPFILSRARLSFERAQDEARGLSANALSRALRVPSGRIVEILNAKRGVSAETALRLGRYIRNDALFWINLQAHHDHACAERDVGKRIAREVETAP